MPDPVYKPDPTGQVGVLPQKAPDVPSGADTSQQLPEGLAEYKKLSTPDQEKLLSEYQQMPGWAKSQAPSWLQTAAMGYNASQGPQATPQSSAPTTTTGNLSSNVPSASTPAPATSPTGSPMFDPMAINAFYSMGIAPILQQLQTNLGGENAQFTNMAQNVFNTLGKNMPQSEQAAMAGTIPMMGAQQNNVMAALMGAAMSGQGLDVLNQNIGKEATAQEAAYRQLLSNPSLSSLGQAASALPGGVPAQGTVAPTTSATDPLVANNVLPGS